MSSESVHWPWFWAFCTLAGVSIGAALGQHSVLFALQGAFLTVLAADRLDEAWLGL